MASIHPLHKVFAALNAPEKVGADSIKWTGPHMGTPFMLRRVFGGQTFAMAYLSLRLLVPEQVPWKMHANLLESTHTEKAIVFRLCSKRDAVLATLHMLQDDKMIGIVNFSLQTSEGTSWTSSQKPHSIPSDIEQCTLITDMHQLAPNPVVAKLSDARFNKEWLLKLRLLDDDHFFGRSTKKKPVQTVMTLNRDAIGPVLDTFDQVAALLLLADFMVLQSINNVHVRFGKAEHGIAGSTMNFTAYFFDVKNTKTTESFLLENWLEVFSHNVAYLQGRLFDMNGHCLLSYAQETFTFPIKM